MDKAAAKGTDATLARLQSFILDVVAPLVRIVEDVQTGSLSADSAAEVAKSALLLLWNTSAQTARERGEERPSSALVRNFTPWQRRRTSSQRLLLYCWERRLRQR